MERRSICYAYLFVFFAIFKFDTCKTVAEDFITSLDLKIPCVKSQVLLIKASLAKNRN